MASKNGRAIVTPAPFNTVLREICFLKINIGFSLFSLCHLRSRRLGGGGRSMLQTSVRMNDPLNNREESVVVFGRVPYGCPDLRHVEVLQLAVDGVHHQLLRERLRELCWTARQILAQIRGAIKRKPAGKHGAYINRRILRLTIHCAE